MSDEAVIDTLVAAGERLSRFFERRRAQIKFLMQKEELQSSAERLFAMAGRLVDSQEEERRRIAREIHDDFTQRLAVVSMKIGNLAGHDRASTASELDAGLEDVRESIVAVAGDLRDLCTSFILQCWPCWVWSGPCERCAKSSSGHAESRRALQAAASDRDASEQTAMCLYRVLQESLMNIAKHSGSKTAFVGLTRQGNQLEMRIRDQGSGFCADANGPQGIGLVNIEERVRLLEGDLVIDSSVGSGTEILVRLPAAPQS